MFEPVLVLNANFEPIHVCNTRRAIGLILTGKANLVLNGRGEIKTVSLVSPDLLLSASPTWSKGRVPKSA